MLSRFWCGPRAVLTYPEPQSELTKSGFFFKTAKKNVALLVRSLFFRAFSKVTMWFWCLSCFWCGPLGELALLSVLVQSEMPNAHLVRSMRFWWPLSAFLNEPSSWQLIFYLEVSHFASRSRQARRLFELAFFFEAALDARNGRAARLLGVSHRRKGRKVVGRKQPNGLIAGNVVSRQILVLKLLRDHVVVVVEEHGRVNALLDLGTCIELY